MLYTVYVVYIHYIIAYYVMHHLYYFDHIDYLYVFILNSQRNIIWVFPKMVVPNNHWFSY